MEFNKNILKNFIVFEGLDCSGKTEAVKEVYNLLTRAGYIVKKHREPTSGVTGCLIRELLSDKKGIYKIDSTLFTYLFAADRYEHLYLQDRGILTHIYKKNIVLCDRYLFSSIAYNSNENLLNLVLELNNKFPLPEVLIYIDIPYKVSIARIKKLRKNKDITDTEENMRRVYEIYEYVLENLEKNTNVKVMRICGINTQKSIHKIISEKLIEHLDKKENLYEL